MSDSPSPVELPFVETVANGVTVRVGSRSYVFEYTEVGTLVYSGEFLTNVAEDEDDELFDPTQYR
jgi:hypothetical protein